MLTYVHYLYLSIIYYNYIKVVAKCNVLGKCLCNCTSLITEYIMNHVAGSFADTICATATIITSVIVVCVCVCI